MRNRWYGAALVGLCITLASGVAKADVIFSDDFSRPDSGDLGSAWTQVNGQMGIAGGATPMVLDQTNLAIVNGVSVDYTDASLSMIVSQPGASYAYASMVYGYLDEDHCLSVGVAHVDNYVYNAIGFFYGSDQSATPIGPGMIDLGDNWFVSGVIGTWMSDADTIWLGIDSNFDGTWEQTYGVTGVSGLTLGTGVGMGMGTNREMLVHNYVVESKGTADVPEPSCLALLVGAGLAGTLLRRRR